MNLRDLRDGMRKVDTGKCMVTELGDERTVNLKAGGTARVRNITISDENGDATLVLWNEQIDGVEKGTNLEVATGYTTMFRGEVQLNVGTYGKLHIIG